MAKQNSIRADPPPQQPPTPEEQVKDLLLILDNEKLLLSALAGVDKNGKLKTVPTDDKHNNEFLKISPSDYWLETFAKNFWSQLQDPTKFRLIKLKQSDLDDPLVKQAMKDINDGKITKAVVKFLEKYEIKPQDLKNINRQNSKKMAKQNQNQDTGTVEQQQPPRYRYTEQLIDWDDLKKNGVSKDYLEAKGLLDQMLRGNKTNELVPISIDTGSVSMRADARLSFRQESDGSIKLNIHALKQHPELDKPFMGHIFSEEDKKNLLNLDPDINTGHNMGRVVPLRSRSGEYVDSFISLDKLTNQISTTPVSQAFINEEIGGIKLTDNELDELKEGRAIHLKDMTSSKGKTFSADVQYNAERRGIEYLFEKQYKMKYGQEIGGVKLTNHQVDAFNDGRAIKVENMVTKSGNLTSSFLKRNALTGKTDYTRYNPDNPGEIIIPKEINGVKTTAEEQKELSQGKPIYLYDMTGTDHEKFNGYIKLDMNTGAQMYSSTVEGFEHKQSFKIPEEILGKKLTAKQRAELQDGKTVLVEGLKGFNGQTVAQYVKLNNAGNKLNYFTDNPDIKRDKTQQTAQTAVVKQKEDQKQENKKGRGRSL